MQNIRLGYVGCGQMAQRVHLPNFSATPGCEIVALAEVREKLGRTVQKRFEIPRFYSHHRKMAEDRDIDAFAVSAAFGVQGGIARDLLLTGRPVFTEKPMAISVDQAEVIVEATRTPGARLMVAYMKRYDAGNELVKETIDGWRQSGELGEVTFARAHGFCGDWLGGLDTPMATSREPIPQTEVSCPTWLPESFCRPYVSFLQQYTHNINLLRYFLGTGDNVKIRSVDLDDDGMTGIVILDLDGVRGVLESGQLNFHRWDEHTQVYFEKGWVKASSPPLLLKNTPAEVEIYTGGKDHVFSHPLPRDRWSWSYQREANHFIDAVRNGTEFLSSGEDTLTDVRLFEEIYRNFLKSRGKA